MSETKLDAGMPSAKVILTGQLTVAGESMSQLAACVSKQPPEQSGGEGGGSDGGLEGGGEGGGNEGGGGGGGSDGGSDGGKGGGDGYRGDEMYAVLDERGASHQIDLTVRGGG